jgi:hypothetical protein
VHTSDLSDFDPEILDLSSDDADIDGDAPWPPEGQILKCHEMTSCGEQH